MPDNHRNTNNLPVVVARDVVEDFSSNRFDLGSIPSTANSKEFAVVIQQCSQCYNLLTNCVEAFGGSNPLFGQFFF
jgi:hypothetical protein